jgi:predicted ester cyclase
VITKQEAEKLAGCWVEAWNAHDLEAILSHYDENIVLISPIAQKVVNAPSGLIEGKDALRAYFARGLEVYPDLRFEPIDLMWGVNSLVLYYKNQNGTTAGEFMEVGPSGKIVRVVTHYNAW